MSPVLKTACRLTLSGALVLLGPLGVPLASAQVMPPPENVVQLSATAQQEVVQDWLTAVLVTRHQAPDAATVQSQLKVTLDRALTHARGRVAPGVEVSTGAFSVQPRYGREGQISGWQGQAELLVQGRDVPRVAQLAGDTPGMAVLQMAFSLSREASQRLEAEVRQEAIARFQATAQQVAQDFGFKGYSLREIAVSEGGVPAIPRARVLMAAEAAMASAPVPTEPGKATVQVTVSGSVQLK